MVLVLYGATQAPVTIRVTNAMRTTQRCSLVFIEDWIRKGDLPGGITGCCSLNNVQESCGGAWNTLFRFLMCKIIKRRKKQPFDLKKNILKMLHVWQSGIGKVDRSPAKSGDRTWFGNVLNARDVWDIKKEAVRHRTTS